MKRSLFTILGLTFVATLLAAPAPAPTPGKVGAVTCQITADATCELGKTPKVTVKLTNRTADEILLIGSLDGSDCLARYPHLQFQVIGPDGKSALKPLARCGNTNPLTVKDFVKVLAGAAFNPYEAVGGHGFFGSSQIRAENFDRPGKYRIRFTYNTQTPDDRNFGGTPRTDAALPAELKLLLNRVPKLTLTSDEVVVEVIKK